jgi:hypothetical protein
MATRLRRYDEIAIAPMFDAFRASLADGFRGLPGCDRREHQPASAARC